MSYFLFFRKHLSFILITGLVIGLLTLFLSLIVPNKFESSTKLLVIQSGLESVDPFAASKSAENLSSVLKQVVYTNSFLTRVQNTNYFITDTFGSTETKRLKKWQKMVHVNSVKDTGILEVKVYHERRDQAEQISHAIAHVFMENGQEYHGGHNVVIRLIDGPRVSDRTVLPNVPQNAILGFLAGIIMAVLYLVIRYESGNRDIVRFSRGMFRKKIRDERITPPAINPQPVGLSTIDKKLDELVTEDRVKQLAHASDNEVEEEIAKNLIKGLQRSLEG
jgi:capsular polysaccharide biosynthesis protein